MAKRKPLIAGNWKMNLTLKEAVDLVNSVAEGIKGFKEVDVLVCPPFTALSHVKEALENSTIYLGAQNMHWESAGAFTGEISGQMLSDIGCTHVILGHSERRLLFGESDEIVDRKVSAATKLGLVPILCIGETLDQRDQGETLRVLETQLKGSLAYSLNNKALDPTLTVAYEPVWAIGTGKTATPEQAQEAHSFIREWFRSNFNAQAADTLRILYGGSVKPNNISELMAQQDIDGALVGGASLKADSFVDIIRKAKV